MLLSLADAITKLRTEMTDYPASIDHYIPDRVLYDYALDALEHAEAARLLSGTAFARAAYANARSGFEAAQDAQYLVTDEGEYDLRGCYARAAEAIDNEAITRRFAKANEVAGLPPVAVRRAEDVIIEDAKHWDEVAPGKDRGKLLRQAFEAVQACPDRQHHWSGLTRSARGGANWVHGGQPGAIDLEYSLYSALSAHAHSRPRTGSRQMMDDGAGGLEIGGHPSDAETPGDLAAYACVATLAALQRRRAFFRAA